MRTELLPAILTADANELSRLLLFLSGKTAWAQVDIMDGVFVPSKSVPVSAIQHNDPSLKLEAHLMVARPEMYVESCAQAGFSRIIFHYEAKRDARPLFDEIKSSGLERGIAINPETAVAEILPFLNSVDTVLLLGVNPGFTGQRFQEQILKKINELQRHAPTVPISIDGGIDFDNASRVIMAGADRIVVGSAIFSEPDPEAALNQFKGLVSI